MMQSRSIFVLSPGDEFPVQSPSLADMIVGDFPSMTNEELSMVFERESEARAEPETREVR